MANPLSQFVAPNGDVDLTSAVSIFSQSNAGSFTRWVVLRFEIGDGSKDLASAADTELTFVITRGGKYLTTLTVTVPDAQDQLSIDTEPLTWKASETIAVTLESDQAGDTDVDVTVEALDVSPLQSVISGRAVEVESDGVAHADLKEVDGTDVEKTSDGRQQVGVAEWNDIELSTTNPLPNASADASGGLPVSDAGGLNLDALLGKLNVAGTLAHSSDAGTYKATSVTVSDKTGFALTSAEKTAIAVAVAQDILNDSDGTAVMQGLANIIAADWVAGDASPLAIVAALKADAEWSDLAAIASVASAIKTVTDNLPNSGALSDLANILSIVNSGSHGNAALQSLIDIVDGIVDSIKLKTDGLNFTGDDVQSAASNMRGTDGANTTAPPTVDQIDTKLTTEHGAGSWQPGSGGGGGSGDSFIMVAAPLAIGDNQRVEGTRFELYRSEVKYTSFGVSDSNADPVDLSGLTLRFVVSDLKGRNLQVLNTGDAGLVVFGDDNDQVRFLNSSSVTASVRELKWTLWDATGSTEQVLGRGRIEVRDAAVVV